MAVFQSLPSGLTQWIGADLLGLNPGIYSNWRECRQGFRLMAALPWPLPLPAAGVGDGHDLLAIGGQIKIGDVVDYRIAATQG